MQMLASPVLQADPTRGVLAGPILPGGTPDNPLAMGGSPFPPFVTMPLSPLRRVSMLNLELAQRMTAPVTVVAEVDASGLIAVREALKPLAARYLGMPLTYLPFFAMATVRALKAYPIMNAAFGPQGFVIPRYINLGIATSVPGGVLLPTVAGAERKSFWELARDIYIQTQKARAGLATPQDLSGQTFVITNTGRWGGTLFGTPIIQPPNVGILAFEAIQKRPVVVENDQIAVRPMMYLALTADHRAVDGAEMIAFLNKVKESLEHVQM
ncbi:MAG: 2-oxo acid dehydrogenase subunit E2 [Symbiobacterium sp.]|uniref:2-oxo acid dehydrogenase subunit E2 n=1 Tax=Symbiobacterium sp. TaxID=1971213 RepID=UPI003464D148